MAVLWVNELDGYLYKLMRDYQYFHPGEFSAAQTAGYGKSARADTFDALIEKVLVRTDTKRTRNPTLQKALPELRLAKRQFTDFDYKLISLCHGEAVTVWAKETKSLLSHNSKTEIANLVPLQRHLDSYFRKNDPKAVHQILVTLEAFLAFDDEAIRDSRTKLESLTEDVWMQALVEGKEI